MSSSADIGDGIGALIGAGMPTLAPMRVAIFGGDGGGM